MKTGRTEEGKERKEKRTGRCERDTLGTARDSGRGESRDIVHSCLNPSRIKDLKKY